MIFKKLPNQLALAQYRGTDRTVLLYEIDDLFEASLVERPPADGDRRARKVVATEHGRTMFAEIEGAVRAAERGVLAALDNTEQASVPSAA